VDRDRELARHFLAAIAYRTQKALRGAPAHYPDFAAGNQVRTPAEILRHMTSLMGYVRTLFLGGTYPLPDPLPTFAGEVGRFHMQGATLAAIDLTLAAAPSRAAPSRTTHPFRQPSVIPPQRFVPNPA
jgi:hypothetical protein